MWKFGSFFFSFFLGGGWGGGGGCSRCTPGSCNILIYNSIFPAHPINGPGFYNLFLPGGNLLKFFVLEEVPIMVLFAIYTFLVI